MNLESTKKESEESSVGNVIPTEFSHERFKWFAVLAQSGMEKRAKSTLEDRIKKLKMENSGKKLQIIIITKNDIYSS